MNRCFSCLLFACLLGLLGCRQEDPPTPTRPGPANAGPSDAGNLDLPDSPVAGFLGREPSTGTNNTEPANAADTRGSTQAARSEATSDQALPSPQVSGDNVTQDRTSAAVSDDGFLPRRRIGPLELVTVDPERIAASGLRSSDSPHLLLITDLPDIAPFESFHAVIEQAISGWCRFFRADPGRFKDWKLTCFLVVDAERFAAAGLLPGPGLLPRGELPPGGWQYGNQIWVRHQPGPYYTRHMLLHEGTHAFCAFNFGTLGPPWLAEGLAEYLAVHRWQDGRLELAARGLSRDDLPYWGRVKLIRDAYRTGAPKTLREVLQFSPNAFPQTESYAWSWAAVSMMDQHPEIAPLFRAAIERLAEVPPSQWQRDFLASLPVRADRLEVQWQVDTTSLQYGHDFARTAVDWKEPKSLQGDTASIIIPADGRWHSSGWILSPGEWRLQAVGRYQIAQDQGGPWIAEPEGITLEYSEGFPLGQLQYTLVGEPGLLVGLSELTAPQKLGNGVSFRTGGQELFLRVNDSPRELGDNSGSVEVTAVRQ